MYARNMGFDTDKLNNELQVMTFLHTNNIVDKPL